MSEERNWDEEFEEILDDSDQWIPEFYEDEDADLGPAIAEGASLEEAIEEWKSWREGEQRKGAI